MSTIINHKQSLFDALIKRGFYNPHDVFNHPPDIYAEPENSKYQYRIEIVKWNTSSAGVVKLGARWDEKQNRYILSTYKQGSVRRYKHGEKMR